MSSTDEGTCAAVPAINQRFSLFEKWKTFITEYQEHSRQLFTIYKSIRLQGGPKATQRCKQDLEYYVINYRCKFGIRRDSKSKGYRQTTTFKADCPAYIILRCKDNESGEWALEIEDLNLAHVNHENSEKMIHLLPENRKIKSQFLEGTMSTLEMRPNKKLLQSELHAKGCHVSLKDLHNAAANLTAKNGDDLEAAVKNLREIYDATVSILHEGKDFKGLFFATDDMINSVKSYPEIILMDGTYKLLRTNLTVVIFLVVDSSGYSEIGGVGLISSEHKDVLTWLLETFQKVSENPNVKCFMTDKDMKERDVIKSVFPGIPTYLCQFHVLQTFGRTFTKDKFYLPKAARKEILDALNSITYSSSLEQYENRYKVLSEIATTDFKQYFDKNWHAIKEDWVTCFMNKSNFKIVTNNRLESINGKIKQVVKRNSSLLDFVEHFFKWLHSKNFETDLKIGYSILKKPFTLVDDSIAAEYQNLLTKFAFNLVNKELRAVTNLNEPRQVDVAVTSETCTCEFYTANQLPCRHIFRLRKEQQLDLFVVSACANRWKKQYVVENQRMFNDNLGKDKVSETEPVSQNRVQRKQIKIKKASTVPEKRKLMVLYCNNLANTASLSCNERFEEKLKLVQDLDKYWRDGKRVTLTVVDEINDLSTSFQNLSTDKTELAHVELPTPIKIVGKPRGANKTCNKKIMKK